MGYTKRAIKGVSWMSAFRLVTRLFSFLKIAILARVLSPSDFGIFGIASITLALLELLTETGVNVFLIQSKEDIKKNIDSAWVVSIARGVLIALLILISSPFISSFFNSPKSLTILILISLVPLIRGFINPMIVKFQKELNFKNEFWLRSSIFIVDATVAIIFALLTHSVYSLIWGLLAGAVLEVLVSFFIIKPTPGINFQRAYISEILHKGKWVTAYGVFNYLAQEGDSIMVGRLLGAPILGVYQMAYKISIIPLSEISDVFNRVVFPVYSIIGGDKQRLKAAFFKTIGVISILSLILSTILFLFPREIILIVLGEKWLQAEGVLRVLSIYGFLRAISGPASALFLGIERQKYVTFVVIARFLTLVVSIYPLIILFGLSGAAYSALLSVLIEIPVIMYFVFKVFK